MTDQLVLCTADALIGKSSDAIPRIASLTATEDASTAALALLLEGVIGKGLDFQYLPGVRSPNWLKIKHPGAVPPERFRNSESAEVRGQSRFDGASVGVCFPSAVLISACSGAWWAKGAVSRNGSDGP